jgi:hypothetical protein
MLSTSDLMIESEFGLYIILTMTPIRKWLLKRVSHCLLEDDASDNRTRGQHVVTHTEATLEHATEQIKINLKFKLNVQS